MSLKVYTWLLLRKFLLVIILSLQEFVYLYKLILLQESDKTRIREYVKASAMFDVTHMVIFTSTKRSKMKRHK